MNELTPVGAIWMATSAVCAAAIGYKVGTYLPRFSWKYLWPAPSIAFLALPGEWALLGIVGVVVTLAWWAGLSEWRDPKWVP